MTADQFSNWISGYFTLSPLSVREVKIKSALDRMPALDFCYWLSGAFECGEFELTKAELRMKDHLSLVFNKVTPDRNKKQELSIYNRYDESSLVSTKMRNNLRPIC